MVVGTEIHVSRFKSPPRKGGPGDSAPSGPSSNDRDQDVPLPTAPSPANSLDPAVIQTDEINEIRDEINETKEKKLNGRDKNDSPNGEAPYTSSLSGDKETPSFIKGGPTLKAGRRIITVNKPKSVNKVLSMEVGNPLVNKAGDLISLNITLNKGTKKVGRPKKSATTMSEMSETRDKSKRSADAMSETNGISPEKKKSKE